MKKILITITLSLAIFSSYNLWSQPPPPPSGGHGLTGNQNGGNAPIGSGIFILVALSATYAGKKVYDIRKKNLEE